VSPMGFFASIDTQPRFLQDDHLRRSLGNSPLECPADGSLRSESSSPISMSGRSLLIRGRGAILLQPAIGCGEVFSEAILGPLGVIQDMYLDDIHKMVGR
jgi:hypothetical protein